MILTQPTPLAEIQKLAALSFGDFVKAVVDVELGVIAVGGELHADGEAFLLGRGSRQQDLWGINIYPGLQGGERVEFDSIINIRPGQGNRSRTVEDLALRTRILDIVQHLIPR